MNEVRRKAGASGRLSRRSRALSVLLLFCALLFSPACGERLANGDEATGQPAAERDAGAKVAAGEPERPTVEVRNKPADKEQGGLEQAEAEQDGGIAFVHRAESGNVSANSTYIDHPLTNANPDAVVFATRVQSSEASATDNARSIGVWYDAGRERWAVFNQDRSPMPEGAAFNLAVSETPYRPSGAGGAGGTVLVHRAESGNVSANSTYIDHPLTNGNPDAVLAATSNWNPGGEGGKYNDHAVGVWYDANEEKWAVFNQDRSPMPEGAAFNLAIMGEPEKAGLSVHRATPDNTVEDATYLDLSSADGDPDAVLSVTSNWNPGGGGGTYHDHPIGVRYDADSERWAIYDADGAPMPEGVTFNVGEYSAIVVAADAAEQVGGRSDGESAQAAETQEPAGGSGEPEGPPEYRNFFSEGDPETPENLVGSGSSAGAIPAVKPFNFGRDPGGPEDKTLYLSVPKIGLERVPIYNSTSEEDLARSAVHVPATGFPWQEGANTFIAGHRIGYPNTGSQYVFFNLVDLAEGDEIFVEDSAGGRYVYSVTKQVVVGPNDVESMNPVEGKSVISLQTCTLPDYAERIIVRGELVEKSA